MSYNKEEDYGKQKFSLKTWKKMLPFFKPYTAIIVFTICIMVISAAADVMYPLFQKYAVDVFVENMSTDGLIPFAVVCGSVVIIQAISVILFLRNAMKIEMSTGRDLKQKAFVHLQKLSFSYYNTTPVGYIIARVMSDTNKIGSMVAWGMVDMMWAIIYVIGVFIAMIMLNWKLALVVMTVIPAIALISVYFQNRLLDENRKIRKINSSITGAFNEGITGSVTSKTMVIEDKNLESFSKLTNDMYRHTMKYTFLNAVFIPLVLFFSSMAVAIVLAWGGHLAMENLLEFGTLSAFISYSIGIFEPIQQIARIASNFISTQANIERVTALLEKQPDIIDTPEVIEKYGDSFSPKRENWESLHGDVEFEDVTFKYPDGDEYVLEHFNLKVAAGTTVAIVGETGAGKSTLVNLACRFFEPTSGRILIDGRDYKERSQLWLHSNLGYVLQSPHLFSGTVMENIRFGRLDASDEEVMQAARTVSAHDKIIGMEEGYLTDVGEGGDKLSTGEKQLVSFARAVLADPRIFVLDEATSSVDTETEQIIQNAISHLLQNRTSFIIAHRLSTIRQADIILVVKNGKIIERGSHDELMNARSHYFELYMKQFEQEAGAAVFDGGVA